MKVHYGLERGQDLTFYQVSEFLKIPVDQLFPYIKMFPFLFMVSTSTADH